MSPVIRARAFALRAIARALSFATVLLSPLCAQSVSQTITWAASPQLVASNVAVRPATQSLLHSFNTPWNAIQGHPPGTTSAGDGLWDPVARQVYPSVVNFLNAKCPNFVYRYPGGTVSNTFNWKDSIVQPATSRPQQWVSSWGLYVTPDFGFDEFMKFVSQVRGQVALTINLSMTPQDAADWVEYCNAPDDGNHPWAALRAANGHPAPYNVRYWELGNEMDSNSEFLWTTSQYINAAVPIATAMRAVDPNIQIVGHTASGGNLGTSTWYNWHRTLLADPNLGPLMSGMALHIYYDGNGVSVKGADATFTGTVINDASPKPVWITEHAKDLNYQQGTQNDQTTWPQNTLMPGTVASSDMLLAFNYHPQVTMAHWHALGGVGPWRPFNTVDSATGTYSNTLGTQPIAYAFALLGKYLPGKTVLTTAVYTPNNSSYSGGYDVRGIALQDADGKGLYVAATNRHTAGYATQVTLPGLAAGNYVAVREHVGGADAGASGVIRDYFNLAVTASDTNGVFTFNLPHQSAAVVQPIDLNQLINPSMETDANANGIPDNWTVRTAGGATGTVSLVSGTSFDGVKNANLAITNGTGSLQLSTTGNSALGSTGFVGQHSNDYFLASACVRANNLDANGALVRVQIFQKDAQGQNVFVQGINSTAITGTSSGWVTLTVPAFRPNDYIQAGYTFNYLEVIVQTKSATGSVDCDALGLVQLANQLVNSSLETDANGNGIPDNWDVRISSGSSGTVQRLSGSAENGDFYARLTKTGGTGAVSIAQSSWNNANLNTNGYVLNRAAQSFAASAFIRSNGLDSAGAWLRIQIFQKNPDGTLTFVKGINSPIVTGTTGWTKVTVPAFCPQDYIGAGATLGRIEAAVQTSSLAGSADVDDINLHLEP